MKPRFDFRSSHFSAISRDRHVFFCFSYKLILAFSNIESSMDYDVHPTDLASSNLSDIITPSSIKCFPIWTRVRCNAAFQIEFIFHCFFSLVSIRTGYCFLESVRILKQWTSHAHAPLCWFPSSIIVILRITGSSTVTSSMSGSSYTSQSLDSSAFG